MQKRKSIFTLSSLIRIIILIALYILIGNTPYIKQNPIVPGAIVAVNMIVVIIAGILYGRSTGFVVGLLATFFNVMTPAGNAFELAAVIPHAIMGWCAGALKDSTNTFVASLSIIIGHILNIAAFTIIGIFSLSILNTTRFWMGITYETIFGIVAVVIIVWVYQLLFGK